jgi:phage/plasmid-like protein (TIGR03299 family)
LLALVSPAYEPLQNEEAFAFFEPLVKSGLSKFETAGALNNGERVWVQVHAGDAIEVADGDRVERFVLLANSHDGRGAVTLRFTPIRVVCQNTLNIATAGGEKVVGVRDSRHMRDRLRDQQAEWLAELIASTFAFAAEQFRKLASAPVTAEQRERYLLQLFPPTERQRDARQAPDSWIRINKVLLDDRVSPTSTRETWWALYNAVTRAEDFRATREISAEARLDRVWFGRGADLKVNALETALRMGGSG